MLLQDFVGESCRLAEERVRVVRSGVSVGAGCVPQCLAVPSSCRVGRIIAHCRICRLESNEGSLDVLVTAGVNNRAAFVIQKPLPDSSNGTILGGRDASLWWDQLSFATVAIRGRVTRAPAARERSMGYTITRSRRIAQTQTNNIADITKKRRSDAHADLGRNKNGN